MEGRIKEYTVDVCNEGNVESFSYIKKKCEFGDERTHIAQSIKTPVLILSI